MASAEQIADLIGGYTDLKAYFEGKRDAIEADLDAAEVRVGDTRRTFFVDQVNGDDTNSGVTSDEPLQSLEAAIEKSVWGGFLAIQLMSDYEVSTNVNFRTGAVSITGWPSTVRELTWADRIDDANTQSPQLGSGFNNMDLVFTRITLRSRVMAPHVTRKHMIGCTGFRTTTFFLSTIEAAPGDDLAIFQGPSGHGFGFVLTNSTASADIAGLWVDGTPAGTDPDVIGRLAYTNVTSL